MVCERMPTPSVLLLIPPLTQLNTPYPSTAYLTGFLRGRGIEASQADLGIEMVLRLFCRSGLQGLFEQVRKRENELPGEARQMLAVEPAYLNAIEPVIEFLQGRNPSLALLLARPGFLPQGPRFAGQRGSAASSRALSEQDRAKRFATLYLEDLADLIQATVSPHFALSRYAEHIARAASSFETIIDAVAVPPTLTDQFMLESLWEHLERPQSFARLPDCSLSREPLWRVSYCPLDQEPTTRHRYCPWRRVCQHGASPSFGPPRIRLCRLRHARRRGASTALADRTSGRNQTAHATLPDLLSGQGSSGLCE